jgi:hypothetical protein
MDIRTPPKFEPPPLDMTLDGQFREPPAMPAATKIVRLAVIVAALATIGAVALLALWFALILIPVAIGAGLVAWGVLRFQQWRGRGPLARFSGQFRR